VILALIKSETINLEWEDISAGIRNDEAPDDKLFIIIEITSDDQISVITTN
jgi:hypothetical protein